MSKKRNNDGADRENPFPQSSKGHFGFPIVALGASAGGLGPLKTIFSEVKPGSDVAWVVVSHLDPHHATMLPDLLQKVTDLKVSQITDGMTIQTDHIYVIPPDHELIIADNCTFMLKKRESDKITLPINTFLVSLAKHCRENAIAVILSGSGSDGTKGIKVIKEQFGLVVIQDPETAQYKGMPSAAMATGLADEILDPEQIPTFLAEFVHHHRQRLSKVKSEKIFGTEKINVVCKILQRRTGHDFSGYKQNTVIRRIGRRIDLHRLENIDQYIRLLQETPQEINALFGELLIGVTNFFRDPPAWDVLYQKVLPLICDQKVHGSALRIWVPGTSTGEEAYSMAILLQEYMDEKNIVLKPVVFATDIDDSAVEKARKGIFPQSIESDVSKERLSRYFTNQDKQYIISRDIRETVIFAPQNLLKDPPFSKLDLICCRNVLIYMNSELQKKIFPLFHYSLNEDGVLFLGSSESVGEYDDLFTMIDSKWKIYKRKKDRSHRGPLDFPLMHTLPDVSQPKKIPQIDIEKWIGQKLLDEYVPASVVIDHEGKIQYIHGRTGKYLEPAPGQAKWDIYGMARQGLKTTLKAAVHQALTRKARVERHNVRVKTNGEHVNVSLDVRPFQDGRNLLMIAFLEVAETVTETPARQVDRDSYYDGLEQELKDTRENLQSTVEELETSNEELRSMNEEYQSTNEELKSANEELETSREELQSLNEELTTVNNELQDKIASLNEAQKEMQMFLDSLDIPTLFLDDALQIVRFTVQAANIFHIIESDIGRPIQHFASKLADKDFIEEAREVLRTLRQKEREVCTTDGHWYLRRTLPYRTADNRIRGVAINFVDINEMKSTVAEMEKSRIAAKGLARVIDDPLVILDNQFRVIMASDSFCKQFNFSREQVENKVFFEIGDGLMDVESVKQYLQKVTDSGVAKSVVTEKTIGRGKQAFHFRAERVGSEKTNQWCVVLRMERHSVNR